MPMKPQLGIAYMPTMRCIGSTILWPYSLDGACANQAESFFSPDASR
jgi:hypothetical protein